MLLAQALRVALFWLLGISELTARRCLEVHKLVFVLINRSVRQFLAIFFLSALCIPTLYKAGLFTLYQLNRDYITSNYCVNKDRPITMCYGKCFLERGLSIADHIPSAKNLVLQLKFESSEFETTGFVASFSVGEI